MRVTIPELSLVLLIDPVGSGKTKFAARHFRSTEVLSLAALRAMIADDDESEGATEAAWAALLELAARRLSLGRLTVVDADLVDSERREPFLQLAAEHHYVASAIVFDDSISVERDGFRRVFRLSSAPEVEIAEVHRLPLWSSRAEETGPLDIVGSIHGRFDELISLLRTLGYQFEPALHHPTGRKLVFLGDLVDHGPRGADVLRLVVDAVDAGIAYAVPGNHDARLVRLLRQEPARAAELETIGAGFAEHVCSFLEASVSHYVFDRGNLVVAHAGLPEAMQGRGSAAVREFALHGENPGAWGEAVSASAPAWVLEYRGAARVVYSHPNVAQSVWLNQTINLATNPAPDGGSLSALRYPEMQMVSQVVAA